MAEAGYQIRNKFYAFPASFRLLDSVLIRELTGMAWAEFINAMPEDDDPDAVGDPAVMVGLIGVAIWQQNPTWPRSKVSKFVQGISMEEVEAIGMDVDDDEVAEADASPPEQKKAGVEKSEQPQEPSGSDSALTLTSSNQKPSGNQLLVTTPE